MSTIKNKRNIGRPRKFSKEDGIKQAHSLFHQHGYDCVSIADICSKLDVPPTSIYAAYGSKLELYELVLEQYSTAFLLGLEHALENTNSASEVYRAALEFSSFSFTEDSTLPGSFFLDAGLNVKGDSLRILIKDHTEKLQIKLAEKLKSVQTPNHFELAKSLVVLIRGLSSELRIGGDPEDLLITTEILCSAFE